MIECIRWCSWFCPKGWLLLMMALLLLLLLPLLMSVNNQSRICWCKRKFNVRRKVVTVCRWLLPYVSIIRVVVDVVVRVVVMTVTAAITIQKVSWLFLVVFPRSSVTVVGLLKIVAIVASRWLWWWWSIVVIRGRTTRRGTSLLQMSWMFLMMPPISTSKGRTVIVVVFVVGWWLLVIVFIVRWWFLVKSLLHLFHSTITRIITVVAVVRLLMVRRNGHDRNCCSSLQLRFPCTFCLANQFLPQKL